MGFTGGRYRFGLGNQEVNLQFDFELFSSDGDLNPRTSTNVSSGGILAYQFSDAIENFRARLSDNTLGDRLQFDSLIITDSFGFSGSPIDVERPLTLDLTARYLRAGTTLTQLNGETYRSPISVSEDTIEYIFSSPALKSLGVSELTFVIEDQDTGLNGFQVNGNTLDTPDAINDAINNIESIFDNLGSIPVLVRVSGRANDNPNLIDSAAATGSGELAARSVIIEAEDINPANITNYQDEVFAQPDPGGSGLSLFGTGQTQGTISFQAQDYSLSGAYNLRVNTFDENDGLGNIQVQVTNSSGTPELGIDLNSDGIPDGVTIQLNENTSSNVPRNDNFRSYFIGGLDLDPTDTITITGNADGTEWARIDNLIFDSI